MWPAERIFGVKSELARTKAEMQAIHDKAAAEITRLEADDSRSDTWKREAIAEVRNRALAALGPGMRTLQERVAVTRAQAKFWESRNLLLGLQRFDEDPAKDSAIRQRYATELGALGLEELQLVAANARDDNNLPLIWQAHLAGRRHADVKGWTGVDVSDVKVPGQAEALAGIHDCEALVAAGEMIVGQTSGRLTPTRKMELGRVMAQLSESGQQIGYGR